jgi:hypothetical protein
MKQNNQEKIFKITRKKILLFLGGWKARGIPKGGFGRVLARKAKKGEKFWSAGSTSQSTQTRNLPLLEMAFPFPVMAPITSTCPFFDPTSGNFPFGTVPKPAICHNW